MTLSRRDVLAMSTAAVAASALPSRSPPPTRPSRSGTRSTPAPSAARRSRSRRRRSSPRRPATTPSSRGSSSCRTHARRGGSLKDLGKQIADLGLKVESAIGFAKWIVERRPGAAEGAGPGEAGHGDGRWPSAASGSPPRRPGRPTSRSPSLGVVADRYRTLAELGAKIGVIPEAEVWGFSKTLSQLGETVLVAMESGHPQACVLPDVYHLYKGGSGFDGLKLMPARRSASSTSTTTRRTWTATASRTPTACTPATASPRWPTCSGRCGTSATAGCCRWSCSTPSTGSGTRSRWSKTGLARQGGGAAALRNGQLSGYGLDRLETCSAAGFAHARNMTTT